MKIKGISASVGRAQGKIIKINKKEDFSRVKSGDVLLLETSTADISKVINKIKAVIVESGGITSHAAVLSRENNLPCIVAAVDACKVLNNGDEIEVNADKGLIHVL